MPWPNARCGFGVRVGSKRSGSENARGSRFAAPMPATTKAPAGTRVSPFDLMQRPVTNGEYLEFVRKYPSWRRGDAPVALAEPRYLSHWHGALEPGPGAPPDRPVTWVSWFAASAYCEAQHDGRDRRRYGIEAGGGAASLPVTEQTP